MRAGLPDRRADAGEPGRRERRLHQRARPRGRQRLPLLRRRLPADLQDQGRPHRRGRGQGRAGQPQPALRQGPLRLRLRPPPGPADRAADPQGRRRRSTTSTIDPANPYTHFRKASWEEALDRAAAGLKRIRDRDGGSALAGFGSAKGSNEEAYLFQKLVRTGFGSNNVDHCTRLCHASSVAALMEGIGSGAVTAPFTAAADADVIIVIGARPTENHPVAATFFKQAAKRGAKLFVMDPRGQFLARYATQMLQFKPGRDVAMLNALLHTIIEEGLYDRQYVQAHTEDFEKLREHIRDYAPEKMARDLRHRRRDPARGRARPTPAPSAAIIFWGMGISQHIHGTDNARCLIALALVTGQVGRPGTGLHPLRGQNNVQGASDAGLIPMVYPDYQSVEDPDVRAKFEALWQTRARRRSAA